MNKKLLIELFKNKVEYFFYIPLSVIAFYIMSKKYGFETAIGVFLTFYCVFSLVYNIVTVIRAATGYKKREYVGLTLFEKIFIVSSNITIILLMIFFFNYKVRILIIGLTLGYLIAFAVWLIYSKRR